MPSSARCRHQRTRPPTTAHTKIRRHTACLESHQISATSTPFNMPDADLACPFYEPWHARTCRHRKLRLPGGAGSTMPELEPGQIRPRRRHPTARPAPPPAPAPAPAIFRLTTAGPQPRHARPPRSVTSTRTTPPAAWIVTVTVCPGAPELLCRTLFPNSSPSSAASSPHGCPGPSTPAVNARTTRARSARPATVTLPHTAAPAIRAPAPPPPAPGNPPGRRADTPMHARLGGLRQARNTPPERSVRARP